MLNGYWHYKEVHLFFNSSFLSCSVSYSSSSPGKPGGRTSLDTYELSMWQGVFGHMVPVALIEGPNIMRMECMGKSTRITKIFQNWLRSRNLITGANNWAISIVIYLEVFIKCSKKCWNFELKRKEVDYNIYKSNSDKLYVKRRTTLSFSDFRIIQVYSNSHKRSVVKGYAKICKIKQFYRHSNR